MVPVWAVVGHLRAETEVKDPSLFLEPFGSVAYRNPWRGVNSYCGAPFIKKK